MKEEDSNSNWFTKWEEELPSPEELMPLSQTLITPDLALAFDIPGYNSRCRDLKGVGPTFPLTQSPSQSQQLQGPSSQLHHHHHQQQQHPEYEGSEIAGGGSGGGMGGSGDEQARTLKRPRLVWTPQLHKRFVDAVAHLGIKNAVPKTIMQLMSVDGLTRENVASHLQKYRLYLKRMQGLSSAAAGPAGAGAHSDPATEQLFATGPVPNHFLNRPAGGGGGGAELFMPFVPVAAALQHRHHHQQQMAAAAAAHQHQQQYYQQRHMGHLGSPPSSGFDHGFMPRQQGGVQRMVGGVSSGTVVGQTPLTGPYGEEFDSGRSGGGERKVLTLFPTNDD